MRVFYAIPVILVIFAVGYLIGYQQKARVVPYTPTAAVSIDSIPGEPSADADPSIADEPAKERDEVAALDVDKNP
jgi:hypothetical protein